MRGGSLGINFLVDDTSNFKGREAMMMLESPKNTFMQNYMMVQLKSINNHVEYEAFITRMTLAT